MRITGKQAKDVVTQRELHIFGKLMPVEAKYYKYKTTDKKSGEVTDEGGEVEYPKWLTLPTNKRGQRWQIGIDQRMFRPDFENPTVRGVMVDFREWHQFVLPGITNAVGAGAESIDKFLDMADSESWYAEAVLKATGEFYNNKPQHVIQFVRLTQDEAVIREWHKEYYPQGEVQVPDDVTERGKNVFKMVKGNIDRFNTVVSEDEELAPYLTQFAENDYALVR